MYNKSKKRNVVFRKSAILAFVFIIIASIGMSVVTINGYFSCTVIDHRK